MTLAEPVHEVLNLPPIGRLRAASGAEACVNGNLLALHDESGAEIASFDAATRTLRVRAGAGDLELEATGKIVIRAGQGVEVQAATTKFKANEFVVEAQSASHRVRNWNVSALLGRERFREAYRDVENVLETRVGQLRTFAKGALELFARRVRLKSEEHASIDGKRVLLG